MPPIIGFLGPLLATLGGGSAAAGAAALGSLASAGVGIGETVAHSGAQPQMPQITMPTSTPPVTTPPPALINPQTIAQVGANTQYNTGGGTSPDYLQALLARLDPSGGSSLGGG